MAQNKFRSQNTISGKEGRVFSNGKEIFHVKNIEAIFEKEKAEIKVMGRRVTGRKTVGGSGTGTLTVYKATSEYGQEAQNYIKKGVDPYFTLEVVTDDKSSGRGTERIALREVNFDSMVVLNLDADAEVLEQELPFTFEDMDVLGKLKSGI